MREQPSAHPELFVSIQKGAHREHLSGSFAANKDTPVHRWFRYSTGFSGSWVEGLLRKESEAGPIHVFDPFAGCGTTLIAAEQCGVQAWGIDAHPFVARVAQAKLAYRSSPEDFFRLAREVLTKARKMRPSIGKYAPLIRKCYTDEALQQLDCLRRSVASIANASDAALLVWLALVVILRPTSHAGTANCQYILPSHRKMKVRMPLSAFQEVASTIYTDMLSVRGDGPAAVFQIDDARSCKTLPEQHFDFVLTSPPYPNNYDYADATRLEMTFFGEIMRWGDLHAHVRKHLLRSCTQHVPDKTVNLEEILAHPELTPIREEIEAVCRELGNIRLTRGGKKTYHNMVGCYFFDLAQVWSALRRLCKSPSKVCFVIGDSAPYGVYVPVVEWLSKLALAAGFQTCTFEKIRNRNVKWKNRKHRVPLCEGRLWVCG